MFQFKNNGILVLLIIPVSVFLMLFTGAAFAKHFIDAKFEDSIINIFVAAGFIVSGFLIKYADEEYITDEYGERHYMEFDNRFMYLKMKLWVYICWILGGLILLEGVGSLVKALF